MLNQFDQKGGRHLDILQGTTSINDYTFMNGELTSLTIPNSVTSIGIGAFTGCTSLQTVTLSNSVTTISDNKFF